MSTSSTFGSSGHERLPHHQGCPGGFFRVSAGRLSRHLVQSRALDVYRKQVVGDAMLAGDEDTAPGASAGETLGAVPDMSSPAREEAKRLVASGVGYSIHLASCRQFGQWIGEHSGIFCNF